jgi:hypothetical protein
MPKIDGLLLIVSFYNTKLLTSLLKTIMPCSICRETGHNATTCTNSIITISTDLLIRTVLESANEAQMLITSQDFRFFKRVVKRCIFSTTSNWNLALFKRVDERFISAFNTYPGGDHLPRLLQRHCIDAITRHRRFSIEENITNPRTLTSFKKKYISILCFIGRYLTDYQQEQDLIDLSTVQVDDNIPTPTPISPTSVTTDGNVQLAPLVTPPIYGTNIQTVIPNTPPTPTWRRANARETPPPAPRRRYRRNMNNYYQQQKPNVPFHMDNNDASYIHDDACAICMEHIDDKNVIALQCKHAYCANCVAEFVNRCNGKCPSCRENIQKICFKPSILPDNFNKMISILNGNS